MLFSLTHLPGRSQSHLPHSPVPAKPLPRGARLRGGLSRLGASVLSGLGLCHASFRASYLLWKPCASRAASGAALPLAPQLRRLLCSCRCCAPSARPALSSIPLLGPPRRVAETPSALLTAPAAATSVPSTGRAFSGKPELPQMAYAQEHEIMAFKNHTHERALLCANIHTVCKDRNLHLAISIQQTFSGCPPKTPKPGAKDRKKTRREVGWSLEIHR